jgi:hypothetical protein
MREGERGRRRRFEALFASYSSDIVAYCGWRSTRPLVCRGRPRLTGRRRWCTRHFAASGQVIAGPTHAPRPALRSRSRQPPTRCARSSSQPPRTSPWRPARQGNASAIPRRGALSCGPLRSARRLRRRLPLRWHPTSAVVCSAPSPRSPAQGTGVATASAGRHARRRGLRGAGRRESLAAIGEWPATARPGPGRAREQGEAGDLWLAQWAHAAYRRRR